MLDAPLELCDVRKIVDPDDPRVTIGAVSEDGVRYLDHAQIAKLWPSVVDLAIERATIAVRHSSDLLRDGPPVSLQHRDVILVDDGAVSLSEIRAAARSLQARDPRTLVLALPVADPSIVDRLRIDFDRIVCLESEPILGSVGSRYRDFAPVSDAEVAALLQDAHRAHPEPARGI